MITIVIYGPKAIGKSALAKWLAEQLKNTPPPSVTRAEAFALLSSNGDPAVPGVFEVEATGQVGGFSKPVRDPFPPCAYNGNRCMGCEDCRNWSR